MPGSEEDNLNINTIRFLSVDAVEKAKSGHPGTPMGAATIVYILWDRFLKYNPKDPDWLDRDRFVLSAGHASMLLYSLLYLTGYDLSLDDIKLFRQLGSKTPGHPEHGVTQGVEATTGPLGQGFANGVGMAIAERWLSEHYNRLGFKIIDHFTYALVSDGDMQEGIASEAASLAGTLKLSKLIYLYDSNEVQQDGKTIDSFKESVSQRYEAYGWNVIGPIDGEDIKEVEFAIRLAQGQTIKPNLIICKTIIGYGSPNKAGTNLAHGEPLGSEEVILTKRNLGWKYQEPFSVPSEVLDYFRKAIERGKCAQQEWQELFNDYIKTYPGEAKQLKSALVGKLPAGWYSHLPGLFENQNKPLSTRDVSGEILDAISNKIPFLLGGAADLAGSTRTSLRRYGNFSETCYSGRNLHYGLREHAMGAISNGLALHGGILPYAGTFLIFSDYMRPAIRLAAMMKLHLIYVFTHDSVGLGEDGPTHQPVEQIMNLRMVPNLTVIRPADTVETIEAWKIAVTRKRGPIALILTRQIVPILNKVVTESSKGVWRGGYILWESGSTSPQIIIVGSGSEVHLALEAGMVLENQGISARVVSMPCWAIFDEQPLKYRSHVFPPQIKARISIEAGTPMGWERYTGLEGKAIGISYYGVSAPGNIVYEHFNLTVKQIVKTAIKMYKELLCPRV
jgi:transketolase